MKFLTQSFLKLRKLQHRQLCNEARLEPVKLAYATYENTLPVQDIHQNPLVVMHGLFGSKSNWNSLCKVFQQKTKPSRKIIALDARNHGDSPHDPHHSYELLALDLKNFFDSVGIEKASVLGHSMGGRTAMLFALKYPELVEKLIVVDISPISTSPDISSMPIYMRALNSLKIPSNIPLSRARLAADLQLVEGGITDKNLRAFLLTNLIQTQNGSFNWRVNIPALLMNLDNIKRFPYEKGKVFDGPTLFIGGSSSDYIKKEDIPGIKNIFPNSAVQYIEGAGHWLHSEKPTEFLQLSVEFLNRPNTS
ncbi:protein ABHD11 [Coccinella septempunctata]|uniref:protein ABHD11 n=1 Tax=Coccinella septempunctata TaxID=41139 RepID=UPI001D060F6F|nr:protein ABHD11 [Coccinella septempunctata]